MKPKSSKPKSPSQVHLDIGASPDAQIQQSLTFETVDALLAYDREELVDVPDRIGRMLKASFPQHFVKWSAGNPGPK